MPSNFTSHSLSSVRTYYLFGQGTTAWCTGTWDYMKCLQGSIDIKSCVLFCEPITNVIVIVALREKIPIVQWMPHEEE